MSQITSGGRSIFFTAGIMVLLLLTRSGKLHIRTGRARALVAALIVLIAVFTIARGNDLFFEIYTYFAIPVPLLAHWAEVIQASGSQTYGAGFIYGFLTLAFRLSEATGNPFGANISELIAMPQEYWVELLPGRIFNAFVTLFYYFFLDFRWIGVAFGGFLWGVIGQSSYERMWGGSRRAAMFGLLMIQVAVMTFARWEITNGSLVIALVLIPVFIRANRPATNLQAGKWKRSVYTGRTPAHSQVDLPPLSPHKSARGSG